MQDDLRALPSVERLLQTEPLRSAAEQGPRALAVEAARRELEQCREAIVAGNGGSGAEEIATRAAERDAASGAPVARPVINATGIVIHTNLGRAPLAFEALEAIDSAASGYSQPRVRARTGRARQPPGPRRAARARADRRRGGDRGQQQRRRGAASRWRRSRRGREVVISRGQLVEIGGVVPHAGDPRGVGRAARRGGDDEPHAARATTSARSAPTRRR